MSRVRPPSRGRRRWFAALAVSLAGVLAAWLLSAGGAACATGPVGAHAPLRVDALYVALSGSDGTVDARTTLSAYPGETPVLSFSAQSEDPAKRGMALVASFWHVYGIVVERAGRNFNFDDGTSTFSNNVSCDSGDNDRIIGDDDGTNQFWSEETGNGAACADYAGDLEWSFAEDGSLVVTFGGDQVMG